MTEEEQRGPSDDDGYQGSKQCLFVSFGVWYLRLLRRHLMFCLNLGQMSNSLLRDRIGLNIKTRELRMAARGVWSVGADDSKDSQNTATAGEASLDISDNVDEDSVNGARQSDDTKAVDVPTRDSNLESQESVSSAPVVESADVEGQTQRLNKLLLRLQDVVVASKVSRFFEP
jgi:hypothetical protein